MKSNLDCFYKIIKSVRKLSYDDLVYNLKEALSKAHRQADKDFLIQCLTSLNEKKMNSEVTKEDVEFIENQVEQTLGASVEMLARQPFVRAMVDVYGRGKNKVLRSFKMDYSLGDKDLGALQSLQDFNCWWVRGKVVDKTKDIIQELAKETLENGDTRAVFAEKLQTALLNDVKETKQYFELLADHVLTKTQNMGHVSGYEEAGVEYVRIVAVLDNRTSLICRTLHDRIFEVKSFRKQYDNIISAAKKRDIDGVKAAQPMLDAKTAANITNMISTKEFEKMGFKMPPYHFHCRTTHVAHFMPKKNNLKEEYGFKAKKDDIEKLTDAEKALWISEMQKKAEENKLQYNKKDLSDDVKHWPEFEVTSEGAYINKCREVIKNAKIIGVKKWREELQLQFSDGEFVVTCDKWNIRNGSKPTANFFKYWFLGQIRRLK